MNASKKSKHYLNDGFAGFFLDEKVSADAE